MTVFLIAEMVFGLYKVLLQHTKGSLYAFEGNWPNLEQSLKKNKPVKQNPKVERRQIQCLHLGTALNAVPKTAKPAMDNIIFFHRNCKCIIV